MVKIGSKPNPEKVSVNRHHTSSVEEGVRCAPTLLMIKFAGSSVAMYGGYRMVRAMEYWTLVKPRSFSSPATLALPKFALSRNLIV